MPNDLCPKMDTSPFAMAWGLCLLKSPSIENLHCERNGLDYQQCPIYQQYEHKCYEEMCADISSEMME